MGIQKTKSIKVDARKFIKLINNGAQSKLAFFEGIVKRMGTDNGANWRLTSLDANIMVFEDVDLNQYYIADISKKKGRVNIDNIRSVNIVEDEKPDLFHNNCVDLVNAICENKFSDADKAFKKIESQRFSPKIIPESGVITTRDGIARKIVLSNQVFKETHVPVIIEKLASALRGDCIELSEGRVVRGSFRESKEPFVIPISEYVRRRIIARKMKAIAEGAYKHNSFCKLISDLSKLVLEGKVREAVHIAAAFLREEQEFCLLNDEETRRLVDNSLASIGIFEGRIAQNIATLFRKTNLSVNKSNIIEAWTRTAKKASNSTLMSNVAVIESSKEFIHDYDRFLKAIFNENSGIKTDRAHAYRNALKVFVPVLEKLEGAENEASKMQEMIDMLSDENVDDATVYKAEELLSDLSDELVDEVIQLSDYEDMPGQTPDEDNDFQDDGQVVALPEVGGELPDNTPDLGPTPPSPSMSGMPDMQPAASGVMTADINPKDGVVFIESMALSQINEDLDSWKINGHLYINEDGFDDCFNQLQKYIARCIELGPNANSIREQFEKIRDVVLETGTDVVIDSLHDPYEKTVSETVYKLSNEPQSSDIRMDELQSGSPVWPDGVSSVSGRDGEGAENAEDYTLKSGLKSAGKHRMNDLQKGEAGTRPPVWPNAPQTASGRDGTGAQSAPDYELNGGLKGADGLRMNDLQKGEAGTRPPVWPNAPKKSDGRHANGTALGEGKADVDMGVDFMGPDSIIPTKVHSASGEDADSVKDNGSGEVNDGLKSAGLRMNDLQGKGVQPGSSTQATGRDGTGATAASGGEMKGDLKSAGLNMGNDFQGSIRLGVNTTSGSGTDSTGATYKEGTFSDRLEAAIKEADKDGGWEKPWLKDSTDLKDEVPAKPNNKVAKGKPKVDSTVKTDGTNFEQSDTCEDQYKSPTKKHALNYPNKGKSTNSKTVGEDIEIEANPAAGSIILRSSDEDLASAVQMVLDSMKGSATGVLDEPIVGEPVDGLETGLSDSPESIEPELDNDLGDEVDGDTDLPSVDDKLDLTDEADLTDEPDLAGTDETELPSVDDEEDNEVDDEVEAGPPPAGSDLEDEDAISEFGASSTEAPEVDGDTVCQDCNASPCGCEVDGDSCTKCGATPCKCKVAGGKTDKKSDKKSESNKKAESKSKVKSKTESKSKDKKSESK